MDNNNLTPDEQWTYDVEPKEESQTLTLNTASKYVDRDIRINIPQYYSDATQEKSGLMSAEDKTKLDGISNSADNTGNAWTHQTFEGDIDSLIGKKFIGSYWVNKNNTTGTYPTTGVQNYGNLTVLATGDNSCIQLLTGYSSTGSSHMFVRTRANSSWSVWTHLLTENDSYTEAYIDGLIDTKLGVIENGSY